METEDQTDETAPEGETAIEIPAIAAPAAIETSTGMPSGMDTVEAWARAKGMLPEFHLVPAPARVLAKHPKASPTRVHNPKFAEYSRARDSLHWRINTEITEADFNKAVETAAAHVYR